MFNRFLPRARQPHFMSWVFALMMLVITPAHGGPLDDLEMDVLAPGEMPGEAMSRIQLPGTAPRERLELGVGDVLGDGSTPALNEALQSFDRDNGFGGPGATPPEPPEAAGGP